MYKIKYRTYHSLGDDSMKKINNFKVYFSNILCNKYHMSKEGIEGYWNNKEKQQSFENKKLMGTLIGLSELIGASTLSIVDRSTKLLIPIAILGTVGVLTTKISVTRKNPYDLKEYIDIEKDYNIEKANYKKLFN